MDQENIHETRPNAASIGRTSGCLGAGAEQRKILMMISERRARRRFDVVREPRQLSRAASASWVMSRRVEEALRRWNDRDRDRSRRTRY